MDPFECTIVESESQKGRRGNKRISLAYAGLVEMPKVILRGFANQIQFLDLSHNDFRKLSFLEHFPGLQTLVLDRNFHLDCNTLPKLNHLRILWLNNCNLINITDWLHQLQAQCPNLKHLSMMCNPVGQTVLNGVTPADEHAYRRQVIRILPQLSHFDGVTVSQPQRRWAASDAESLVPQVEAVVKRKLQKVWHYSARLHKQFRSMDSLNSTLFNFGSKHVSVGS